MKPTLAITILTLAATPALADDEYATYEGSLQSGFGVSAMIGGGVTRFTDQTMRDSVATVGGLWDVRLSIGTHATLAIDLAYVGTAAKLTGSDSTLIGTSNECAVRYNVFPHRAWTPYGFAGIGWQRYDVSGTEPRMNGTDESVVYPLGAGISYRDTSGFVLDVRGTFRPSSGDDLVPETAGTTFAPMHSWSVSSALGFEF